jgi:predicted nucleotidyltransferase component of viral defense system
MDDYKKQVALLLNVIPEVDKEECFLLHGGTAINLFVRNMPRLSVDIDLTYISVENRTTSFENINKSLERIKNNIEKRISNSKVHHQKELLKLQISNDEVQIKLEVNQGMRGTIDAIEKRVLCEAAQNQFDAFCSMNVVSFGQLYGGKICAALDRQHPRDLFDVKALLENEGFTQEIKNGFLYALLSSKRPINEMLFPNLIDQNQVFTSQFEGMTSEPFSYSDFEAIRMKMIDAIHVSLSTEDKDFILSFEETEPNWAIYDFENYPSVQWKLQNLMKLKSENPENHREGVNVRRKKLLNNSKR